MTSKKYKLILIGVVAFALSVLGYFLTNTQKEDSIELSLEQLKSNEVYQYKEIEWGIDFNELKEKLSCTLIEDSSKSGAPQEYAFYKSKNPFVLDGQHGETSFEFHDNKLQIIKFSFNLDENYEEWYTAQIEELVKLYGIQSDKTEATPMGYNSVNHKWIAGDTMLQVTLMTGEGKTPYVMIAIGKI